jgi:hypothetical protein
MRTIRGKKGPFSERPYYTQEEIEEICSGELKRAGLYPVAPGPVRIERFIEKRFGVSPSYEELPEGVLAYTGFDSHGVQKVVISTKLVEHENQVSERRLNATLAHEAGHGLLHAHLFVVVSQGELPFGEAAGKNKVKVLCREESIAVQSGYDGRWWEYQANRAIGSLLLPKSLVGEALKPLLAARGSLGRFFLSEEKREAAGRSIATVFEVNPVVARIRIAELYPKENEEQLTL